MNYPKEYIEFIKTIYQETYSEITAMDISLRALNWKGE